MESWPLLVAFPLVLTVHEAAHAFVAYQSGDRTPYRQGRVTLNPLNHMDILGTVAVPVAVFLATSGAFIFGYARPVITKPERFRKPRLGLALVALAGPTANLATGAIAAVLWRLLHSGPLPSDGLLWFAVASLCLFVFNMIPIPPLDGSKVVQLFLPEAWAGWYLENGGWGLLGTAFILVGCSVLLEVNLLERLLDFSVVPLLDLLTGL